MWRKGVDLGIIDCRKLSIELENVTFPLIEDTEGRGTIRALDEKGKSSEKKITSVLAPSGRSRHEAPARAQDVSPTPSGLCHASCSVDEALEVSTGDSGMAQTQHRDSEGSHSADSVL